MLATMLLALPLGLVDLTHALAPEVPVFPGGTPFVATKQVDYPQGYFIRKFESGEHTGTHVDAPAHYTKGTATVDAIPVADLRGPAVVLDLREQVAKDPDYRVSVTDLLAWERAHGPIPGRSIVVARTGWEERWPDERRYRNADAKGVMHFPGFSVEAVEWLLKEHPSFLGIGIDTLSTDYGPSHEFAVHKRLHGASKYGVENLTNLGALPARGAVMIVAPLKIAGGSGAPARVLAELP
jgi:kynurenine formamidase